MDFKTFWKREAYVAVHAQTGKFRIVKYLILFCIIGAVYLWRGWGTVGFLLFFLTLLSIGVHFLFRWKTEAWTKSCGPYKKIPLPDSTSHF